MKELFDPEVLRSIEAMDHLQANEVCIDLIKNTKTKASKKQHLLLDIQKAESPKEMSRIMWNVMLSGEGLATLGSAWQKLHS
jgi:hypothetical protein